MLFNFFNSYFNACIQNLMILIFYAIFNLKFCKINKYVSKREKDTENHIYLNDKIALPKKKLK